MTYDARSRTQIRAALMFWQQAVHNSRTHPAEIPACRQIFQLANELPMTVEELVDLQTALQHEVVYTTIPVAAAHHSIGAHRIRRELQRSGIKPEPGTRWYTMTDMTAAITRIRRRDVPAKSRS